MKLINPTDDELNVAFAEKVAGWTLHDLRGEPVWFNGPTVIQGSKQSLCFTQSADAVLPWLERASNHRMMLIDTIWYCKNGNYWTIEARKAGEPSGSIFSTSGTLPHAVVIALLRAYGVDVDFTK